MTGDADPGGPPPEPPEERRPDPWTTERARLLLGGTLLALFGAVLGYKVLRAGGLEQSALFYVGLPALIALLVVFTARPRSATGVAVAVTTIALLLAGPLLNEGVVCLIMAAPLFYLVAVGIGLAADRGRQRGGAHALAVLPLLVLLCAEGVGGISYLPRASEGHAERVVDAAPAEIAAALAGAPAYTAPRSAFLRLVPFPRPERAEGTGLAVGDERVVRFAGGHRPTRMVLRVSEAEIGADGGRVVFTVADDSTLARWLRLDRAEAQWRATPQGGTRLAWTLRYERTFDPSWYWGPVQSYGMDRAAGYLADTFACEAGIAGASAEGSDGAGRCRR